MTKQARFLSLPKPTPTYDPWIVVPVGLLLLTGLVMVGNTSYFYASEHFSCPYYLLGKHILALALGTLSLALLALFPSRFYYRSAYPVLGLALILLLVVLLLPSPGPVARWLRVGPLHLQPSELAKWALVLYLARILSKPGIEADAFPWFCALGVGGWVIGLVAVEPDFGTAAFMGLLLWVMLFVAGARCKHLGVLAVAGLGLLVWALFLAPYRTERLMAFLNPWEDPQGKGFQMIQSLLAFGVGGISGVGLGAGQQKMFFLPAAHTDFIFATLGEELGLWGSCGVLVLFLLIGYRGLRAALLHPSRFGCLLAVGVTGIVVGQAALNIAMTVGLLPTKGIPLPLVSYGGSSMVLNLSGLGMLLALSREAEKESHGK